MRFKGGVECHRTDGFPIAGVAAPAVWILSTRGLVEAVALGQEWIDSLSVNYLTSYPELVPTEVVLPAGDTLGVQSPVSASFTPSLYRLGISLHP